MAMGIKESSKKKFRRIVMWSALTLIILLIFLSAYGAFLGAERTRNLVNSLPLMVYWLAFVLVLITGLASFRRLVRVPRLLLMHGGCILILAGAMWGSDAGHKLQKKLFGIDKIKDGQIVIYEGSSQNRVALGTAEEFRKLLFSVDQQGRIEYYWQDGKNLVMLEHRELPFFVELKDFRIEYYKPEYLWVQSHEGRSWKIAVEIGSEFSLGADFGTVKILKVFENFKITIEGGIVYDDPEPGYNPALEVQIKHADGAVTTQYAFERSSGHIHREDKFVLRYQRIISDYISELQIIENNKVVAEKDIEVNHPLHYGGYHFYQHSYDAEAGQYTVLAVTSDTSLALVYAGYLMLCIGVFWQLWLRRIFTGIKLKSE